MELSRIVITGIGLTSPNGDSPAEFRRNLLEGVSGIEWIDRRYVGRVPAGVCHFDPLKYQKKKALRVGTRAGSIAAPKRRLLTVVSTLRLWIDRGSGSMSERLNTVTLRPRTRYTIFRNLISTRGTGRITTILGRSPTIQPARCP